MAINDTYFLTVQGTLQGRNYVHTLHFREQTLQVGNSPSQALIDAWQSACQSAWLGIHTNQYSMNRITAQKICGSLPLPSRVEEGASVTGTRSATGDQLPVWLSVCVNEATGLAGRSRHGRFFISGGYETDVNQETLVPGAGSWINAINAYVAALATFSITGGAALDWRLVVHSRKLAEQPGTQCNVSSEPVTALGVVGRLTSQRSRRA